MYEDREIQNWKIQYIAQITDTMHGRISPLSCTSNIKTILP